MTRPPIDLSPAGNGGAFARLGLSEPPRDEVLRLTILATPARGCGACEHRRRHTEGEMAVFHPYAGHGTNGGTVWSHPDLDPRKGAR